MCSFVTNKIFIDFRFTKMVSFLTWDSNAFITSKMLAAYQRRLWIYEYILIFTVSFSWCYNLLYFTYLQNSHGFFLMIDVLNTTLWVHLQSSAFCFRLSIIVWSYLHYHHFTSSSSALQCSKLYIVQFNLCILRNRNAIVAFAPFYLCAVRGKYSKQNKLYVSLIK